MASPVITPAPLKRHAISLTLFGLFLALACPEIIVLGQKGHPHLWTREILLWTVAIALLFYVVVVEKPTRVDWVETTRLRSVLWGMYSGLAILPKIALIYGWFSVCCT